MENMTDLTRAKGLLSMHLNRLAGHQPLAQGQPKTALPALIADDIEQLVTALLATKSDD